MRHASRPALRTPAALLLALFTTAAPALAVRRDAGRLPAAGLRADVAILRRAYEALHPGLYRYQTKAEMDRRFAGLEAEFGRDRTLAETYLALSVFLATVRCGHTYANFFNQRPAVQDALLKGGRVPFYFRWVDGRMVVTRDFTPGRRLAPGTEVLAVDGVPARAILARLLTVARADGGNDAKRVSYLEVAGRSRFEAFDVYLPLFFPARGETRTFTVRAPGAARRERVELPLLSYEERAAAVGGGAPAGDPSRPLWQVEHLDPETAYLRMPGWALYNSKWDWQGFLEGAMDELVRRATPNLVIDLRGNEGGLDVGDHFLARLIERELPRDAAPQFVSYRAAPADLVPYLDTWDKSFLDWGAAAVPDGARRFRLVREKRGDAAVIAPRGPRYRGRVYVLIDAANSSATFAFAQKVKRARLATLVGQTTGGNQRGINGGAFFFLRLPNSGLEVDLPLIASFPERPLPDGGIEPDVFVRPRVSDIAAGVDTELEAVRALIRRRR